MLSAIGFFGPALCLFGVMLAACDHTLSVVFLTLAMGFNGFTYSGYMVTHVDMSPDFAGNFFLSRYKKYFYTFDFVIHFNYKYY